MRWNPFKTDRSLEESLEPSFEFNFDYEEPSRAYLKNMALQSVIGFVARSVALSTFRHTIDNKRQRGEIDYKLNVRPNNDQSAFEFWYDAIYRTIEKGECLIIFDDQGDMLIADTFERTEYAIFPDTFKGVTVKGYEFQRVFNMEEVIYFKYGNQRLSRFLDGMFKDYTDLFNRMISLQMRTNQLRGIVKVDSKQSLDAKKMAQLQKFIDDLFKSFYEKSIAIVPNLKGFDYEEIASGEGQASKSVEELWKLKDSLINEVADIVGVPQALIHGDIADIDSLMKAYIKFCIDPLNKMIEDELNVKIVGKTDYMQGERIQVVGLKAKDVTDNSEAVDKLVASGAYTRNEVREKFGDERVDDPEMDKFVLTKNYMTVEENSSGGGE